MIRLYVFPIAFLFLASGCFFKSDKTGSADGIICEYLYTDSAGQVLITHEKVFHATSKSSEGGYKQISGFTNTRLSAYDVKDGRLLARTIFGGESEDACLLLTLTGNQLWCVQKNGPVTLQTYDPRTLKVKASPDQLLLQASFLKEHLANPEWYQLPQFYGYDAGRGIILSDDQGFHYALDPVTLKVEKITDVSYQLPPLNDPDITTLRTVYNDSVTLRLDGSPRNYLVIENGNRRLENDPGFLKGGFLVDKNQNRIDNIVRKAATSGSFQGTDRLLLAGSDNFFVLQASSTNKDAGLVLSSLQWAPGQPLRLHWQNNLTGLFFDASNAKETSAFKEVFSSGNPEFTFRWADISRQQLLLTWMLHTTCIDVRTGKVVWQIKH